MTRAKKGPKRVYVLCDAFVAYGTSAGHCRDPVRLHGKAGTCTEAQCDCACADCAAERAK